MRAAARGIARAARRAPRSAGAPAARARRAPCRTRASVAAGRLPPRRAPRRATTPTSSPRSARRASSVCAPRRGPPSSRWATARPPPPRPSKAGRRRGVACTWAPWLRTSAPLLALSTRRSWAGGRAPPPEPRLYLAARAVGACGRGAVTTQARGGVRARATGTGTVRARYSQQLAGGRAGRRAHRTPRRAR